MRSMAFVVATVAGCSSAGGGDLDRISLAANLEAALAAENISDPTALPFQGTAIYAGYMALGLPFEGASQVYVGDLDLDVTFGAARHQVSGTVSYYEGASGSLAISGGNLNREADPDDDFTFDGQLDGTLQLGALAYDIAGNIQGDFLGREEDGVIGIVSGTINGPDGQDIFEGSLAAIRSN